MRSWNSSEKSMSRKEHADWSYYTSEDAATGGAQCLGDVGKSLMEVRELEEVKQKNWHGPLAKNFAIMGQREMGR